MFRAASFIGTIVTVLAVLVSASQAQVSPQLAQKSVDAASIATDVQQKGYVRVIVEFSSSVPANQLRPDPAFLAPIKAQIASMQDAIIAAHFGSATNPNPGQGFPRAILRFDITPGFAVNVSTTELNALAANSRVTKIQLDRADPPTLLQSVPLIGAPTGYTFGATGLNRAVAILDTGVQSNHEFLSGSGKRANSAFRSVWMILAPAIRRFPISSPIRSTR